MATRRFFYYLKFEWVIDRENLDARHVAVYNSVTNKILGLGNCSMRAAVAEYLNVMKIDEEVVSINEVFEDKGSDKKVIIVWIKVQQ